jgi:hypothetical protein
MFRTIEDQFANFQTLFEEWNFCGSGWLDQFARFAKLRSLLEKMASGSTAPRLQTWRKGTQSSAEGNENMHARPEVREILIAGKLKRWALIGQHPHAYPNCSPARARRNFSKLFSRYPQIAQRLGMTPVSAYPPI